MRNPNDPRFSRLRINRRAIAIALFALAVMSSRRLYASATITVDVAGAPQGSSHCSLTDAVQAATTNARVNNCAAGSSTGTDTIVLQAAGPYQGYGKALHIPPGGNAVVIKPSGSTKRYIVAPNYGYPNPAGGTTVCPYPAAIYAGGTLTLNNVEVQSARDDFTNGICQYAGSLTLDNFAVVGDSVNGIYNADACPGGAGFLARGIYSYPNGNNNHRSITITNNSGIWNNCSPNNGGGIALFGDVNLTTNFAFVIDNVTDESGGGIFLSGQWGKMGTVLVQNTDVQYNQAGIEGGWGGGMYLGGDDANATVTYDGHSMQVNDCWTETGGAMYVGSGMGLNKVIIRNMALFENNGAVDGQQAELNSDSWVYNAVSCQTSASLDSMNGSEWSGHSPPLKGDGTCTFP